MDWEKPQIELEISESIISTIFTGKTDFQWLIF